MTIALPGDKSVVAIVLVYRVIHNRRLLITSTAPRVHSREYFGVSAVVEDGYQVDHLFNRLLKSGTPGCHLSHYLIESQMASGKVTFEKVYWQPRSRTSAFCIDARKSTENCSSIPLKEDFNECEPVAFGLGGSPLVTPFGVGNTHALQLRPTDTVQIPMPKASAVTLEGKNTLPITLSAWIYPDDVAAYQRAKHPRGPRSLYDLGLRIRFTSECVKLSPSRFAVSFLVLRVPWWSDAWITLTTVAKRFIAKLRLNISTLHLEQILDTESSLSITQGSNITALAVSPTTPTVAEGIRFKSGLGPQACLYRKTPRFMLSTTVVRQVKVQSPFTSVHPSRPTSGNSERFYLGLPLSDSLFVTLDFRDPNSDHHTSADSYVDFHQVEN